MFAETVSILGETWKIKTGTKKEYKRLKTADGFCDYSTRTIVVETPSDNPTPFQKQDQHEYKRSCLRHEIVHAFLYESGLAHNTLGASQWACNEEMIDWIAQQHEKIHAAFIAAGAIIP